ncbi:hypothetical protein APR43_01695 [Flavobacterium sp. NLM]|nr:hypothetical protein AKO67_07430 [Flavobacterium sp. VMW]OWU92797.1 hypothetical protein APR43_01695 [Flavobacterium sp. NLM]
MPNTGTKGFPLLSGLGKLNPFLVAAILIKDIFFFTSFVHFCKMSLDSATALATVKTLLKIN